MTKAVRWTNEMIDAYVKRRVARHADASFERELSEVMRIGKPAAHPPSLAPARDFSARGKPHQAAGKLYPLVLLCEAHGLPVPRPEYEFSETRGYRFDYAWPQHFIAAEIEGGIWRKGGGAHSHPLNIERDIEKYNLAARLGWRVLRAAPEKLGTLIEPLREMLATRDKPAL